ncbi:MAG: hypothetical protein K8R77_12205 [Anaerolineaceae bacterium]|nr:hypothetical protein [Anaerolineaceae bacterium]
MSLQRIFSLFIVLLILAAAGCGGQVPSAGDATLTIDRLAVLPHEAETAPLMVIMHGHTDNSCFTVISEEITQNEDQVEIVPRTQFTASGDCQTGEFPFERIISLDLSTLPDGPLTIRSGAARVQYMPAGAEPEAQPTPATPSEEPAAAPTAAEAEPTAAPEPTSAPASQTAPQKDCINKAAYYDDITIPDGTSFDPGEEFTKTWRVRNEGSCTWAAEYSLIYDNGDLMGAETSNPIPAAAPGDIIDISMDMTAPSRAGAYTGNWQFKADNDETFGLGSTGEGLLWVKIGVRNTGGGQTTTGTSGSCAYEKQGDVEAQVLSLINNARSQRGLKTLALNSLLSKAALNHSADMACQDFVGHNGSDGSTWYTRIEDLGLAYTSASENIYVGNPSFGGTPQGAFEWWMNSQVHRDNILDSSFTRIGVGCVYSAASSYGGYYTLVFSRP